MILHNIPLETTVLAYCRNVWPTNDWRLNEQNGDIEYRRHGARPLDPWSRLAETMAETVTYEAQSWHDGGRQPLNR